MAIRGEEDGVYGDRIEVYSACQCKLTAKNCEYIHILKE